METERTNFEVFNWLKENQGKHNYSDVFIESYKDTYFLKRLEGKVFHGEFGGFKVTPDNSDKSYFVEEGIRGCEKGYFTVINNKLIKLDPLNNLSLDNKYNKKEKLIVENYIEPKLKYLTIFSKFNILSDNEKMIINEHIQSLEFIINLLYKI